MQYVSSEYNVKSKYEGILLKGYIEERTIEIPIILLRKKQITLVALTYAKSCW